MDFQYDGKKLLLVGGINLTSDVVALAHRNGAKVGVTDFNKNTYLKQIADYPYDVNALDRDALTDLYEEEHYDGILTQFLDITSPTVADVAEVVGAYFPFTREQLRMSTDKKFFKAQCLKYGLDVPREYEDAETGNLDRLEIRYPVIVKPVDSSSSKGVSVCRSKEELAVGIRTAKEKSMSGRVIVEDYIPYDEINLTYIAQNGNIQLAAIHDRYFNTMQDGVIRVPDMYIYPSKYTALVYEKYNDRIIAMFEGLGVKNGSLFLQAIVKDDTVYLYEAGMRLNGCKTYQILELENDYNTLEHLIHYAFTGDMGGSYLFDARFKRWYATWNVVGTPGMVCEQFHGQDEIESYPWLIAVAGRYPEHGLIPANAKGTLVQLVARIHLYADTKEQLLERIAKVQKRFTVTDPEGKAVLLPPHDVEDLREKINYDLFEGSR